MRPKIGILAGGGRLPERLIAALKERGQPYFVIAFKGQTPRGLVHDKPHAWVRLGAAGSVIEALRDAECEEVVMAGAIVRPSLATLFPDAWMAAFIARHGARVLGDDGILSALIKDLEERENFRVVAVDSLLPNILMPEGVLTKIAPNADDKADIRQGMKIAGALGALDVGQGCVVQRGLVLAVEAIEGTEVMLSRIDAVKRKGPGGVLVKVMKPGQEERVDLPTIGPDTIRQVERAGLAGVAVEAEKAVLLDREAAVAAADEAGLFLTGIMADGGRRER